MVNRTTAKKVIDREHELLGEKPSKKELKVHKQLIEEFDKQRLTDFDFTKDFNKMMMRGKK